VSSLFFEQIGGVSFANRPMLDAHPNDPRSLQSTEVFKVDILEREIEAVKPYHLSQNVATSEDSTQHGPPASRLVHKKQDHCFTQGIELKFKAFQLMTLKFVL
jgi:hypothetical protein